MAESSSTSPASSPPAAADASAVSRINGRIIGICVAAALGGFLFGFDTAVINGAVDALSGEFVLNDALKGFSVSSALIGCTVGAWFAGPVSNRMGRVPVMLIAAVMFMASALGSGLAFGVVDFIVWRVVGGLGVGAASVIAPAYIAEVSPASVRGRLGSLQQLAIVISIFVSLLTDAMLANFADGAAKPLWFGMAAWRWMFLAETVPALVYGLFAFRLPESPRFLVARGDYDKASQVLYDFTGIVNVNLKIEEIRSTLDSEKRESLADLRGPALGLRPIVWVGILLSVFQQFVGINVIFYYSTTLWRTVGFQESDALTITVITSVTNIAVTILAILLVDKVGRRPMLLVGSIVMTLSLGMMALAFSFADVSGSDITLSAPWSPVALVSANLFVVAFGATWGAAGAGAARRDVPQSDPRRGAGRGRGGPVGGQFLHLHHLPDLLQHQPHLRLRLLRRVRPAVARLRLLPGARDQGQGAGGDGGPVGLTRRPSPKPSNIQSDSQNCC